MSHVRVYAGLGMVLIGSLFLTGLIPLSVNSVQLSNATVTCNQFSCLASVNINNVNASYPLTVYFLIYCVSGGCGSTNYLYSFYEVVVSGPVSTPVAQQITIVNSFGTYNLSVYVLDKFGYVASKTINIPFSFNSAVTTQGPSSVSITPVPDQFGCGTFTPSTTQTFQAGASPPPITFTVAAKGSCTITGINVYGASSLNVQGTSITLSYSQLSPLVSASNGGAFYITDVTGLPSQLQVLAPSSAYPGCLGSNGGTMTPAVGSIPETAGAQVQVSIALSSGCVLTNWFVTNAGGTAQNVGSANPYTLTMPSQGVASIQAFLTCSTVTGCGASSGGGGGGGGSCASGTNAGITVTVLNSANAPISGATVSVNGVGGSTQTTGINGQAQICNIAVPGGNLLNGYTGQVTVSASASGYTTESATVDVQGGQTSSTTLVLHNGSSLASFGPGQFLGVGLIAVGGIVALTGRGRRRR